jgi:uncharacterized protein (DUF2141 family)
VKGARAAAVVGVLLIGLAPAPGEAVDDMVTLVVSVDGFPDDQGEAGVAVWNGARGFPEDIAHAVATTYVPIAGGTAAARFGPFPPGVYAVTVYHDRDDDETFDKNFLGIPREAWGVSNNVRPRLRAPTFDEARLELEAGEHDVMIHVD